MYIGCISSHPCMDTTEFTNLYLQTLLDTLAFENKDIFLMGDFNINILQYDNGKSRILKLNVSNFILP